ncbi:hypothetical protein ACIBCN_26505 [Nocardia sp. NPDC051052]|uniref:hypothetical protein n=1 Tax=Nocardia sp. NPDC051052 TaxID=3364322 RepID=UPI0037BA5640
MRNLKNSSGGDIGIHASISVAQALFTAGAIDKFGSSSHQRSSAVDDDSWTDCRRFASNHSAT